MAEQSQSEFMAANNPYTSLPTRQPNESLYDYLIRLSNARGGMMLGQRSPTVDDVVAEEITTQPLGTLIKNVTQESGGDNDRPPTDEEREAMRQGSIERAVGMLTGQANPMAQTLGVLGIPGVAIGAFADYNANKALDAQLESLGYTPEQIEAVKSNPDLLNQQLTTQQLGFTSTGYKPNLFDKLPSVTDIFDDILGKSDTMRNNGGSGVLSSGFAPNVPGITSLSNLTPTAPTFMTPTALGMLNTSLVNQNLSVPDYGAGWDAGSGQAFGGSDDTTVSTGGDTSFDTTTFDDIANDPSWGGGDDSSSTDSSGGWSGSYDAGWT